MANILLSDEYYKALGMIVVKMARLESVIEIAIANLLSADIGAAQRVTAGEVFNARLRLLKSLIYYRIHDKDQLRIFKTLFSDLGNLNDKRDGYIHSDWTFLDGYNVVVRRKHSKGAGLTGLVSDSTVPPVIELNEFAETLGQAARDLAAFIKSNLPQIKRSIRICNQLSAEIRKFKSPRTESRNEEK